MNPGIARRWLRLMTRVDGPTNASTALFEPTATILPSRAAKACTVGAPCSNVTILPLRSTRSAGCASAVPVHNTKTSHLNFISNVITIITYDLPSRLLIFEITHHGACSKFRSNGADVPSVVRRCSHAGGRGTLLRRLWFAGDTPFQSPQCAGHCVGVSFSGAVPLPCLPRAIL